MRVRDLALMEVETFCGYKDAGVRLLLTIERNTFVPGNLVMVAGGTLGSRAAPTMAHKSRIAVLQVVALLADVEMVCCSVRSTSHAPRTVRSAVEIVGITLLPGYRCHVSAMQHCWVVSM